MSLTHAPCTLGKVLLAPPKPLGCRLELSGEMVLICVKVAPLLTYVLVPTGTDRAISAYPEIPAG